MEPDVRAGVDVITASPSPFVQAALEYYGSAECAPAVRRLLRARFASDEDPDAAVERFLKRAREAVETKLSAEERKRLVLLFDGDPVRVCARQAANIGTDVDSLVHSLGVAVVAGTKTLIEAHKIDIGRPFVLHLTAPPPATSSTTAFRIASMHGMFEPIAAVTVSERAFRNAFLSRVAALPRAVNFAIFKYDGYDVTGLVFPGDHGAIVFRTAAHALVTARAVLQAALFFAARGVAMARNCQCPEVRTLYMHPDGPRLSPLACAVTAMYGAVDEAARPSLPMCRETSLVFLINMVVAARALAETVDACARFGVMRSFIDTERKALLDHLRRLGVARIDASPEAREELEKLEASLAPNASQNIYTVLTDAVASLTRVIKSLMQAGDDAVSIVTAAADATRTRS